MSGASMGDVTAQADSIQLTAEAQHALVRVDAEQELIDKCAAGCTNVVETYLHMGFSLQECILLVLSHGLLVSTAKLAGAARDEECKQGIVAVPLRPADRLGLRPPYTPSVVSETDEPSTQ